MQLGFYFDQSRCTGCDSCVVACKDSHNILDRDVSLVKILSIEEDKYPHVSVNLLAQVCYHCAEPTCVEACPFDAIAKRTEDGIVVIDSGKCSGIDICDGPCAKACPYHVIQFGSELNARAQKCDFCVERWAQGEKPICVEACPVQALDAGPIEELKAKYGDGKVAVGFDYVIKLHPSVIFKTGVKADVLI